MRQIRDEQRAVRTDLADYRVETHANGRGVDALRAEVAAYRAETQAQRAESAAIIDRVGRSIEHLEADMSAVVRHLCGGGDSTELNREYPGPEAAAAGRNPW